jgi:hypothetical protein
VARKTYRERLQSVLLSVVDPAVGAVDNAYAAVRADRVAAQERRLVTMSLALLAGPSSWSPVPGSPSPAVSRCHGVIGYDADADLLARLTPYVVDGLVAGDVCVVIATPHHLAGLRRRLAIGGFVDTEGLLIELDAEQVLSSFVVDGWPDSGLFDAHVGDVVRGHLRDGVGLRAFGEMVGLLVSRDEAPAALHVEKLWDALQLQLGFPLLCGYPASALAGLDEETAARVFARHTHLAMPA